MDKPRRPTYLEESQQATEAAALRHRPHTRCPGCGGMNYRFLGCLSGRAYGMDFDADVLECLICGREVTN